VADISAQEGDPGAVRLADLLDRMQPDLLAQYEHALATIGNAIVRAGVSLEQAVEHARQILADVTASLRGSEVRVDPGFRLIAWGIGVTRAADDVHPSESLQASSVLFRIVLEAAARCLDDDEPAAFRLLGIVAMALERGITVRVRTAVAGYTSYLLNQVHEAQVNERRRIARDLHDRIGHCISITHRQLELFHLYRDSDPVKAGHKVETAQRAIRESMQNLRAVASELYAVEPAKSLDTALLNYFDTANTEGVDVRVRVSGDESWVLPGMLDEVFLVLREASRNALHHAEASTLIVNVEITPYEIRAFVEDDGRGFDPSLPPESGGLGLSSMRERAYLCGGTVAVRSRPGHGTHIDFAVPLQGERQGHGGG